MSSSGPFGSSGNVRSKYCTKRFGACAQPCSNVPWKTQTLPQNRIYQRPPSFTYSFS